MLYPIAMYPLINGSEGKLQGFRLFCAPSQNMAQGISVMRQMCNVGGYAESTQNLGRNIFMPFEVLQNIFMQVRDCGYVDLRTHKAMELANKWNFRWDIAPKLYIGQTFNVRQLGVVNYDKVDKFYDIAKRLYPSIGTVNISVCEQDNGLTADTESNSLVFINYRGYPLFWVDKKAIKLSSGIQFTAQQRGIYYASKSNTVMVLLPNMRRHQPKRVGYSLLVDTEHAVYILKRDYITKEHLVHQELRFDVQAGVWVSNQQNCNSIAISGFKKEA